MAIIVLKNGKNAKKLNRKDFKMESELQEFLTNNPEIIPIEDIKADAKMMILVREFPVRTGFIDALGVDTDGDIYLLEMKLDKNSDKRKVFAQILEYGAYLYKTYENGDVFLSKLEELMRKNNENLEDKLSLLVLGDKDVDELVENVKRAFEERAYKFFVVMDKVPEEIREVAMFINENSKFDIYLVELQYYEDNGYQIIIPKLFGGVLKKTPSPGRKVWDEVTFFDAVEKNLGRENREVIWKLYTLFKNWISWGAGKSTGSFNLKVPSISKRSILTVWTTGKLTINFGWLDDNEDVKIWREKFRKELRKIEGFDRFVPSSSTGKWPNIPIEVWGPKVNELITVLQNLIPEGD